MREKRISGSGKLTAMWPKHSDYKHDSRVSVLPENPEDGRGQKKLKWKGQQTYISQWQIDATKNTFVEEILRVSPEFHKHKTGGVPLPRAVNSFFTETQKVCLAGAALYKMLSHTLEHEERNEKLHQIGSLTDSFNWSLPTQRRSRSMQASDAHDASKTAIGTEHAHRLDFPKCRVWSAPNDYPSHHTYFTNGKFSKDELPDPQNRSFRALNKRHAWKRTRSH